MCLAGGWPKAMRSGAETRTFGGGLRPIAPKSMRSLHSSVGGASAKKCVVCCHEAKAMSVALPNFT